MLRSEYARRSGVVTYVTQAGGAIEVIHNYRHTVLRAWYAGATARIGSALGILQL